MRKLSSWIDAFIEDTSNLPTPELFQRWAAISAVAGALERKVWTRIYSGVTTFPNMYIVLVAPPGIGKTILTSKVNTLWGGLGTVHTASDNVTAAALGDELRDAERSVVRPNAIPPVDHFNSLLVGSNELSNFLPTYDNSFMSKLVDLYDCNPYSERRRDERNTFKVNKPSLHFFAATQPSFLNDLMPEGAWDQGFAARIIFIYSGDVVRKELQFDVEDSTGLRPGIKTDFKSISELYGRMQFTPEAGAALSEWHIAGGPPIPDHPKLKNYSTRRTMHLAKLCMVASADRADDLKIELIDYQRALNWLLEAEAVMPDIFKSMRRGGDTQAMEELWYFAQRIYIKTRQPVPEHKMIRFLQERTPAHNVMRILEIMQKADHFKVEFIKGVGRCYKPVAKDGV